MRKNPLNQEARKAMHESEDRFHTVFGMAPDAIFIADSSGHIVEVNDAACMQLSYTREELLRKTLFDIVAPQFKEKIEKQLTGSPGIPGFYESIHVRKDGTEVNVAIAVRGISLEGQRGMIGIARDVTERKRTEEALRESERSLATLIANLPGMVFRGGIGRQAPITFMSDGCLALTGRTAEDFVRGTGLSYRDMILEDDRGAVEETIERALRDKGPYEITYRIRTADGRLSWMWERGRGIVAKDGSVQFVEGLVTDITQTRKAEEDRRSLSQQLAQA